MNDEKAKRMKGKLDNFMADIATDMIEPEMFELIKKQLHQNLRNDGLPISINYLKAYLIGFTFAITSMDSLGKHGVMPLIAGTMKIVKDAEDEIAKKVDQTMGPKV